jgi:hypothetical protein
MKKQKILALICGVAITLLVLAGCNGESETNNNDNDREERRTSSSTGNELDLFEGMKLEFETVQVGTIWQNRVTVNTDDVDTTLKSHISYDVMSGDFQNGDTITVTAKISKQFVEDNKFNIPDSLIDGNNLTLTKDFVVDGFYEYISDISQISEDFIVDMENDVERALNEYAVELLAGTSFRFDEFCPRNLFSVFLEQDLGSMTGMSSGVNVSEFEFELDSAYLAVDSKDNSDSKFIFLYEVVATAGVPTINVQSTETYGVMAFSFDNLLLNNDGKSVNEQKMKWLSPEKTGDDIIKLLKIYELEKIK